jgi:heme O synthase-like polyprenyltransferase
MALIATTLLGFHLDRVDSSEAEIEVNRHAVASGGTLVELVSEGVLVLLALTVLAAAVLARSGGLRPLATCLTACTGTAVALACSQALKALHARG